MIAETIAERERCLELAAESIEEWISEKCPWQIDNPKCHANLLAKRIRSLKRQHPLDTAIKGLEEILRYPFNITKTGDVKFGDARHLQKVAKDTLEAIKAKEL